MVCQLWRDLGARRPCKFGRMGTCLPRTPPTTDRVNVGVVTSGKPMLTCVTNGSSFIDHRVAAGYVRVILGFISL